MQREKEGGSLLGCCILARLSTLVLPLSWGARERGALIFASASSNLPSPCSFSTSANRGSSEGILSSATNKPAEAQTCRPKVHFLPKGNIKSGQTRKLPSGKPLDRWAFLCARSLADCEPLKRFSCCARAASRAGPAARCRWRSRGRAWLLRRPHRGLKRQRRRWGTCRQWTAMAAPCSSRR